jgi:hypothetical protein
MRRIYYGIMVLFIFQIAAVGAWASKEDCGEPPNAPAVPAKEVNKEVATTPNDYDEVVEESVGAGYYYLTVINGSTPTPNACGLNPSNASGQWTGWGGPLNGDNVTIGEGAGTRNEIVIGGTYFERGIGTHAIATLEYDLSGKKYVKFECYIGMSDEKDTGGAGADSCGRDGTSDFTFEVDGEEMFKSEVLTGCTDGENTEAVIVEFDIPNGAQKLVIRIGDGGDGNGCDHSCLGDAKLMTSAAGAVEPGDKAANVWGGIKASF